jgi:cytochrome c biogenesis protein CcdA
MPGRQIGSGIEQRLSGFAKDLLDAIGALGLADFWHPHAPAMNMQQFLPTVLLAGVVDGINPCAFSVLLLFISAQPRRPASPGLS